MQNSYLQNATGKVQYGLTNDYMFRMVFQGNKDALCGLISSLLHIDVDEINDITVLNPVVPGEKIDDKTFILDLKVTFNNNTIMNLEMQVRDEGNWPERSLGYLCRCFDNLNKGTNYLDAKTAIHISFLDFTLFPNKPEFCATYKMLNEKNQHEYTSKFMLKVVELNHVELADDEDKKYEIDRWARLFKSKTWEDLKMCAENNSAMNAAVNDMFKFNSDFLVREQCEAREAYYAGEAYKKQKMEALEREVAEKDEQLAEMTSIIENLQKQVEQLINEKNK